MPTSAATFAASKPAPKPGAADAVAAVVSAITGQPMNGTVGGKKGFQPGNTYGAKLHRNQKVGAAKAAHTAAHGAVRSHARAGTLATPAGRAAITASASAARQLQAARATHQRERQDGKNAAARDNRAAARAPATDRAQKTVAATSEMLVKSAHSKLEGLRRGAVAGDHDGDAIIDHVDRLARVTTAKELHEAAARAGIAYEGRRKQDAINGIKNHVYDAKLAADDARAAAAAKVRAAKTDEEEHAAGRQAAREESARQVAAHQVSTGRPSPSANPAPRPPLPRPFVPITPRPAEKSQEARGATPKAEPVRQAVPSPAAQLAAAAQAAGWSNRAEHDRLAAEYLDRHATTTPEAVLPVGRRDMEKVRSFDHGGTTFHFTDSPDGRQKAVAALRNLATNPVPEHISRHTRQVFLTTGQAQREHGKAGFEGYKIAGVANGRSVSIFGADYHDHTHGTLGHELSHNFARHLFGGRTTPTPESDFARAASSGEAPVSRYGASALNEDFATSFEAYYKNKGKFRQDHPERFAVIDRLVKDPNYGG